MVRGMLPYRQHNSLFRNVWVTPRVGYLTLFEVNEVTHLGHSQFTIHPFVERLRR